jgi:nucleotide-binding universal stress UspA family protein
MKLRILVPFDFSAESERALTWAAELRRGMGAAMHVVHVVNPVPPVAAASGLPLVIPQENIDALEDALRTAVARREVDATTEVVIAVSFGDAILEAANAFHADVIVMGTHGRGGLRRLALGSVADVVIRRASCPVVTMRAPEQREPK